ncbi:MAG: type IV secretion system protein, partial [Sphingomonadales bacterium]|nr:type IV secretion system protein [Sphingomonadales bacterium]
MSGCADLTAVAGDGVAPALRAVDCLSGEATGAAFDRLLGLHGALMPALTALLTLYIAVFALGLLAGRTRLGLGALMPRMLGLGLVLAFATSWAAYQSVVWTLATGAPDEIAGAVTGSKGSATQIFAGRIDTLFAALSEISDSAGRQAQPASEPAAAAVTPPASAPTATPASFSPAGLLWIGATMLLLGTVGVLVTARIVLALLLALGPVFVVMALFRATRGLAAGWLRATVLAALAPLFAVIGGAFTLELAAPAVGRLAGPDGVDARGAMAFFLIAAVHAALMVMALRTAATIVNGWAVFPPSVRTDHASPMMFGASVPPMPAPPGLAAAARHPAEAAAAARGAALPAAAE